MPGRCAAPESSPWHRARAAAAPAGLFVELGVDPGHLRAQLAPHHLDLVARLLLAHALEVLLTSPVLGDPLAGEGTAPDVLEDLAHGPARLLPDHPPSPGEVSVLGGVGNRVAHAGDAL